MDEAVAVQGDATAAETGVVEFQAAGDHPVDLARQRSRQDTCL